MTDASATSTRPQKRPRKGLGTWPRHYCDPAVSPKHAKLSPSPRTSPLREPRSPRLEPSIVQYLAVVLGPYTRHHEPSHIIADVLLRVLPMPDCARSTVAIVVHRNGTGACDDLTYRRAGTLANCDRRTAVNRFARTESYGFIHVEPRNYAYGGAAPNLVTAQIPSWVYEQIDTIPAPLRPPSTSARASTADASPLIVEDTTAAAVSRDAHAQVDAATAASGSDTAAPATPTNDVAVTTRDISPAPDANEPRPRAPTLSPDDAAIDTRLEQIHTFSRHRFHIAAIRGFNAQEPKVKRGGGIPNLDDAQILLALDEYIKAQRPKFEHKQKYGEPLPDRTWVENGIHVFLWGKRQQLNGLVPRRPAQADRTRRSPAARSTPRARAPINLAAPVQLGATFDPGTAIVRAVSPGSIAARLLLESGDKIVRIDDHAIASHDDLRAALRALAPGPLTFEWVRANAVVTATLTLEPRGPP